MSRSAFLVVMVAVATVPLGAGCPRDIGEACDDDGQCVTNACFLVCRVNDCSADADCGAEVCEITLDGDDLVGAVCSAPTPRGQQCSFADRTRTVTRNCVDGLACETLERGQATVGICVPPNEPRLLGEPCSADGPCEPPLECTQSVCVES